MPAPWRTGAVQGQSRLPTCAGRTTSRKPRIARPIARLQMRQRELPAAICGLSTYWTELGEDGNLLDTYPKVVH